MPIFLAAPLTKFVAVVLLVTTIFGIGYYRGYAAEKQAWDAAIAEQAVKSAETVIKGAENTAVVVTKYIRVKGATEIRTETVEKEVVRYVEAKHPDCFIENEFEWVWDDLSRMRSSADGVPSPINPTLRTDGGKDSGLTTAEILSAHAGDTKAFYELRDKYEAIVEWVKTNHEIQRQGSGRSR